MGPHGYDYTLQAVMDLQKSVGEINATLAAVKSSVDGMRSKVDELTALKNKVLGGVAVFMAVVAGVGYLAGKASEYVMFKAPAPPIATSVAPSGIGPAAAPLTNIPAPKAP